MCASHVRCSFVLSLYLTNRNKLDERGHFHQKRALRMDFFLQFKQCLNRNKQMVVICPQTRYTTTRNVHANIHTRYFFFIENFTWCIDFSSSNDFMGVLKCLRKISIYTTDLKSFLWQILVLYFVFFSCTSRNGWNMDKSTSSIGKFKKINECDWSNIFMEEWQIISIWSMFSTDFKCHFIHKLYLVCCIQCS